MISFKEFFNISSYEVISHLSREENNNCIDEYEVLMYNENVSQTENIIIEFEKNIDEITVKNIQTYSYYDEQHPKQPCNICGSEVIAKDVLNQDTGEKSKIYVHNCSFNNEEIEGCLKELVENELLRDKFTQEEFEENYGVNYRDDINKQYGFYDAWQKDNFYTIFNYTVYHTAYKKPKELHCKFCQMDEELLVIDGAFYQKCPVLTEHTDRIIHMIKSRAQNEPKLTH